MKFDQLTKKKLRNFDQTPKLTEKFDQLKMSSEIRSTDRFPLTCVDINLTSSSYVPILQFLNHKFEFSFNQVPNVIQGLH